MVGRDASIYLFIGQDNPSKDIKIKKIKEQFFTKAIEDFNLDILYARELNLRTLQERILLLPVKARKRIIVIKGAESLKENIKEFILKYVKGQKFPVVLVLDMNHQDPKDEFIKQIARVAQVFRFQEPAHLDTFALSRQIESGRADASLRVLNQLLRNGEKPERIMGGLRYAWEKGVAEPLKTGKKLKLLLNCDIDIKRGRLNPGFALEKLVISLCRLLPPRRFK